MSSVLRADVEAALTKYVDPYLKINLIEAKAIKEIRIKENAIHIDIVLGYPVDGCRDELIHALKKIIAPLSRHVEISVTAQIAAHVGQRGIKGIPHVKNIIAVASGKGGVGKSTTAVNIALALSAEGARTGILDADIYGPSQPIMLGVSHSPEVENKKILLPIVSHGIQSMSIGYLVDDATPMIWRGPMVSMALQQLLHDTQWENLDYLIVDLPPGTGDIQLTLAQKIPVSAAVIVTTPQDLALMDARRACEMFAKVHVPVLGVIENMSLHTCSKCGHQEAIFGEGGGARFSEKYEVELLGSLPLDKKIREQSDSGKPTVVADPKSAVTKIYRNIARHLAAKLSLQAKDYSSKFPNIVVNH